MDPAPFFQLPYWDALTEPQRRLVAENLRTLRFAKGALDAIPPGKRQSLLDVLAQDPRPGYQHEPERVYGMRFAGRDVRFTVADGVLTVREVR